VKPTFQVNHRENAYLVSV